jgi:hypothetical protein
MASNSLIAFVGGLIVVVTIAFIFPPSGGWRKFPIKPTGILPQNYIAKPWLSREPGRLAAPYRLSRARAAGGFCVAWGKSRPDEFFPPQSVG